MSTVLDGIVYDTNLSRFSRGGTEQMRDRLLMNVSSDLLRDVAVYFSRVRELNSTAKYHVFYAHDTAEDPENEILKTVTFDRYVFVTHWQRDQYISKFNLPYSKSIVIQNAIEKQFEYKKKSTETINFIYHTTPHRGLELLYPIFNELSKEFSNLHLDVYSSFEVYGWPERDRPYKMLFDELKSHPQITYHGAQPNFTVLDALEKAHIFLYPCVWKETSCIALIEAIRSGCLAIHPNYGALPETAQGATVMYDYTEDYNEHLNRAYNITRTVLKSKFDISSAVDPIRSELPFNTIENFTTRWNYLLESMKQGIKR